MQEPVLDLFDTMKPFVDEDEYDVAKAWGINAASLPFAETDEEKPKTAADM